MSRPKPSLRCSSIHESGPPAGVRLSALVFDSSALFGSVLADRPDKLSILGTAHRCC